MNKQLNNIIRETALKVDGKNDKQSSGMLSTDTKKLLQKPRVIRISSISEIKNYNQRKNKDNKLKNEERYTQISFKDQTPPLTQIKGDMEEGEIKYVS